MGLGWLLKGMGTCHSISLFKGKRSGVPTFWGADWGLVLFYLVRFFIPQIVCL